jgi:hypothetical protein
MAFHIGHQNSLLGRFIQATIFYLAFPERLCPHDLGDVGDGRPAVIELAFSVCDPYGVDQIVERTAIPVGELQFTDLFALHIGGFLKMGLKDTEITSVYNPVKFWQMQCLIITRLIQVII